MNTTEFINYIKSIIPIAEHLQDDDDGHTIIFKLSDGRDVLILIE